MSTVRSLAGLLVLAGYLTSQAQNTSNAGWATLESDKYSISYPDTWSQDTSGEQGTHFMLLSPLSDADDDFSENVNLATEDLTGINISLPEYLDLALGNIEVIIEEFKLVESKAVDNGALQCHEIIYTGNYSPYILKFRQRFWIIGETAYVLTSTTEEDQFEAYDEIAGKIFASFIIK